MEDHKHKFVHKPGTWYEVCDCGEEKFLGFPNKVCRSENQRECLIDGWHPGGKMNPDECCNCVHFW